MSNDKNWKATLTNSVTGEDISLPLESHNERFHEMNVVDEDGNYIALVFAPMAEEGWWEDSEALAARARGTGAR